MPGYFTNSTFCEFHHHRGRPIFIVIDALGTHTGNLKAFVQLRELGFGDNFQLGFHQVVVLPQHRNRRPILEAACCGQFLRDSRCFAVIKRRFLLTVLAEEAKNKNEESETKEARTFVRASVKTNFGKPD